MDGEGSVGERDVREVALLRAESSLSTVLADKTVRILESSRGREARLENADWDEVVAQDGEMDRASGETVGLFVFVVAGHDSLELIGDTEKINVGKHKGDCEEGCWAEMVVEEKERENVDRVLTWLKLHVLEKSTEPGGFLLYHKTRFW